MEVIPAEIEVLDGTEVDDDGQMEFVETEAIQLDEGQAIIGTRIVDFNTDGELIKQVMDGKLSFSDYKVQVLDAENEGSDADDQDSDAEYKVDEEDDDDDDDGSMSDESDQPMAHARQLVNSHNFERELQETRKKQLRGQLSTLGSGRRPRRKRSALPPALQGLMGEANLRYARGETEMAEKICMEIIRQVPLAVEPFQTLCQIYEGKDHEKFMQYMFIAGHLNPGDVDHWLRLVEISEEAGNIKQAAMCVSRAIAADPSDIDLRYKRMEYMRLLGDDKSVLKTRLGMVGHLKDPDKQLELMREVATAYHQMGVPERALNAYRRAHKKNGDKFTINDVNQFLELLIDAKCFEDALNVLIQHTQIEMEVLPRTKHKRQSIEKVTMPKDLIPDFRTKASVCLIHMNCAPLHEYIINEAMEALPVETDGDCLLDIAEALMEVEDYPNALYILEALINSENFCMAAVILKHADCLRLMGECDAAIESYRRVIKLAPQHLDARLTLSALLKQKNLHTEALNALEQDHESDVVNPTLLYEHCYMLREVGNIEQYIDLAGVLFSRHTLKFRSREEAEIAMQQKRTYQSKKGVQEFREFKNQEVEDTEKAEFVPDKLPRDKEWEMFVDVTRECYRLRRYSTLMLYVHQGLSSTLFAKYYQELKYMSIVSCLVNKDYMLAGFHAKEMLLKNPMNRRIWNLFMACQQTQNTTLKYNRFLRRWMTKEPEKFEQDAWIWSATYALFCGTYATAVRESAEIFKRNKNPLAALLTAIALAHLAVQKYAHHKSDHVNQAYVFIKGYAKHREPEAEQEVLYNSGRLYQQLGLTPNAVDCYRKVLACKTPEDPKLAGIIDLKKEAAFNLHLIYKDSGNLAMARKTLYDHIVI